MAIRTPTIPEYITVHLGRPEAAARNITVPFIEYIKNVASNEIYANWPRDAIKANVLAIISFTLNRVYNEWYRSLGYNFDITSLPAYDQKFNENSQFFATVSEVVDEIFNNYIVKTGQVQPLYAQYCDGKNTTCKGLSQWGSVDLAKQGKSPLEILRYYYGNNINIVYNAPVGGDIETYPGFDLKLGSTGNFITLLKRQLNRIGENYPAIPIIENDSVYFDIETENAVKKFQSIFDLPVTGIVNKSTWYKIKYIYNAVKKITDLYSEGISKDEVTFEFNQQLKLGDTGTYIRILNYYLDVISYFDSDIPFLDLRGNSFTSNTEQVVKAFQSKFGLNPNGIVDSKTWSKILEVYDNTTSMVPVEYIEYVDEFFPGRFLSKGFLGKDVLRLQNFLFKICERDHEIPGVRVNGEFDSLTEQSVKYIQRKFKLLDNGVVSPVTWYYIVEFSKNKNIV